VNLAGRWFHSLGAFDLGLSHFWGTVRDPVFGVDETGQLRPFYDRVHQTGLELQAITGGWLWKLEGIHRTGQGNAFTAITGGFEYTLGNIKSSGVDVGLLAEYLWDERDALSPFEDDFFVGARIALNDVQDSAVLAGGVVDRTSGTTAFLIEASRRVGSGRQIRMSRFMHFAKTATVRPGLRIISSARRSIQILKHHLLSDPELRLQ
jgi:hypothetical protein